MALSLQRRIARAQENPRIWPGLVELETLIVLERAGSYRHAAKQLGVSTAGISLRIKRLEQFAGILLVRPSQKSGNRSELTPAGHALAEFAEAWLLQLSGKMAELATFPTIVEDESASLPTKDRTQASRRDRIKKLKEPRADEVPLDDALVLSPWSLG